MSQKNYFSYNIIDTIYFNQPTESDLQKIYGIDFSFVRRNPLDYDQLTPAQQELYNENERKFIEAVINKYVMDDFGKGSYIDIDTNIANTDPNKQITYAYFKTNQEIGIELSDMISNINGVHNYKLMSAKDIDFDNVILPNSAITRDFNWGGFDRNRRWGDKPIHINNTFELLNVIDYLLCACDNLWNELYKLKYSVNEGVEIWFTKNAGDATLIGSSMKLVTQDFMRDNTDRTEITKMITYLNPFKYYTSLNNNEDNNFGMVTNFYVANEDQQDLTFDRKIIDSRGRNIILMVILPSSKLIGTRNATTTQNVNNILQQIYAYKIGDELKIYPGSRIDAFVNENNMIINSNELIDFNTKTLKYDTYFKSNSTNNIYSQVYIKFLNSSRFDESITNPYILYYTTNNNGITNKVIVSYNYKDSGLSLATNIRENIEDIINNTPTYQFYNHTLNGEDNINIGTNQFEPKFYIIPDEFFSTLEVATPNSKKFSASSQSIRIYYYKRFNQMSCKVTRIQDNEPIEILPENDPTQTNSLSYNSFRYNVPDGQDITFKFDASYIADSTPSGNPLNLLLDDEYKDIMLYQPGNVPDQDKNKYYQLIDTAQSDTYKRNFEQFTVDTFNSNIPYYTTTDKKSQLYKHIWVKYDNPYKLNLTIDHDALITQSLLYSDVHNEIQAIIDNEEFRLTSYNTYTLNHTLSEGIEEIKLNLRFHIDETSKVKGTECIIPLNINKIYYPTINYYSKNAMDLEINNYSDIQYTYGGGKVATLSEIYNKASRKFGTLKSKINFPQNICQLMSSTQEDIASLDDLQLQKTYDCIYNNAMFEFTYNNNQANIINLIGGWYTYNYVTRHLKKKIAATTLKLNNSSTITLKGELEGYDEYSYNLYIFNLNGFGRNYRLHGNGNTVPDNYDNNSTTLYYPEFDVLSTASNKEYQSINEQLKFKLSDDAQLTYIAVQKDDEDKYVWTENELEFNSGIYIEHTDSNNISYNDFIIKTRPIDIYKTSYLINCINDYNASVQNMTYSTYYLPLAYILINSSTFNPPESTIPSNTAPDINIMSEKIKYGEYMNCWNDETNYHPITLTMKLFNNTTYSNPYYYDSNEAVMKFNIKRTSAPTLHVSGRGHDWIYVSIDAMYYLSEFIEMGLGYKADEINPNATTLGKYAPTGSYFYYDDTYCSYVVNEIYSNTYVKNLGKSHNNHYNYVDLSNLGNNIDALTNPDMPGNNESRTNIVPYPIFKQMIIDDNENVTFSETSYNYDIYRLADINKLAITRTIANPITWNDGVQHDYTDENIEGNGLYTNTTYYTVTFNNDFVNAFGEENSHTLHDDNHDSFNMMLYTIFYSRIKGSKNYQEGVVANGSSNAWICPIIREYIGEEQYQGLYLTAAYHNKLYEFFTFKYDDIYVVKIIDDNDNEDYNYQCYSVAPDPANDFTCEEAYDVQLKVFLENDPDTEYLANWEHVQSLSKVQNIDRPE